MNEHPNASSNVTTDPPEDPNTSQASSASLSHQPQENDLDPRVASAFLLIAVFIGFIVLGFFLVDRVLPLGHTESALIYVAAVIGTGLFWFGRKR